MGSTASQFVDFGSQYKVAFCQPVNLMRPDGNVRFAPTKTDVRVMSLLLRQLSDTIDEAERLAEVLELESFPQVMMLDNFCVSESSGVMPSIRPGPRWANR